MCGIFGFVGIKEAAPIVLNALKKLEYRGYDSAGLATVAGGEVWLKKDAGKLTEVTNRHRLDKLPGHTGIGHVRWATHGEATPRNAHPHLDCCRKVAVVHNGIIENYTELRARLGSRHDFVSDTDTEVIPHLIEESMDTGYSLEEAVLRVAKELKGSYAFLAIVASEPDKIVATRRENPLVVGIGDSGYYIASDTLSFIEDTNRVIFINDGETVILTPETASFLDGEGRAVAKEPNEVSWQWKEVTKEGFDFFMLKEIGEQPLAIRSILAQEKGPIMEMADHIRKAGQIVLTASGSSRYAALIGRYVFSKLAAKFCDVIIASEFQYFSDSVDKDTLVIAVSQSGETADILQGVKKAREKGATVFSLVNVVGSSLARMSDRVIYLNCGPEMGVAATKSFTGQLGAFYLLAFAMADRYDEGIKKITAVSLLVDDYLRDSTRKLPLLARRLGDRKDFYYIARGANYAIAGEGALKMKEIAYVHAEGLPAGELKHGTLALVEQGTPVVAICPDDYTFKDTLSNAAETRARGAFLIGVSDRAEHVFDEWINIPKVEEIFYPLVSIIPLQLFAYYSALARGLDPDMPRNLAKSVTVP